MNIRVLHQGSEIVETKRVTLGKYHREELEGYIESLADDGWVEMDRHYHSANTTEFTFERRLPLGEVESDNETLRHALGLWLAWHEGPEGPDILFSEGAKALKATREALAEKEMP